jgi:outer membrane murein-binding lipoprotein Lpp
MVAAAIVGAAVVGGGVSIASSNKASKTAKQTAAQNNALQQQVYQQNTAALSPYVAAGNSATPAIQALLGLNGSGQAAIDSQNAAFQNFRNSTGYQDQFAEGQRSITGALGNRGLLDSGAAQKALVRYGQSQANQSFGTYYNALSGQQQLGLAAASAQAGVGTTYANAVTNNNNNAANTVSNAALSNAATINGVLGNALSAYGYSRGMGSSYGSALNPQRPGYPAPSIYQG